MSPGLGSLVNQQDYEGTHIKALGIGQYTINSSILLSTQEGVSTLQNYRLINTRVPCGRDFREDRPLA